MAVLDVQTFKGITEDSYIDDSIAKENTEEWIELEKGIQRVTVSGFRSTIEFIDNLDASLILSDVDGVVLSLIDSFVKTLPVQFTKKLATLGFSKAPKMIKAETTHFVSEIIKKDGIFITNRQTHNVWDNIFFTTKLIDEFIEINQNVKVAQGLDRQTGGLLAQKKAQKNLYSLIDKNLEKHTVGKPLNIVIVSDEIADVKDLYRSMKRIYHGLAERIHFIEKFAYPLREAKNFLKHISGGASLSDYGIGDVKFAKQIRQHIITKSPNINPDDINIYMIRINALSKIMNKIILLTGSGSIDNSGKIQLHIEG